MSYFRQSPANSITGSSSKILAGYLLVSMGVLLAASGGTWDINNHLLNKPETFFAPPHAVLYSGAAGAVVGAIILFLTSRRDGAIITPIKLVFGGVLTLVIAGPIDFMWHSAFGLDGLLSPPHFVLVSGMLVSSIGSLAGMSYQNNVAFRRPLHPALIIVGMLPVWLAASGIIDMFSLPFSDTVHFKFNPNPALGATVATLGFPIIISAVACSSSSLAGRRFGVVTALGASFIINAMLALIVPNGALVQTLPFYATNIIPFLAADGLLSFSRSKISLYSAGAVVGIAFLTLYYPLITYTYEKALEQRTVWPSLIAITYFAILGKVMLLVIAPAGAMGLLGAAASRRLIAKNKAL